MYNYDYQFRLIVVGDSTVGKVGNIEYRIEFFIFIFSLHYYAAFVMEFFLKIQ